MREEGYYWVRFSNNWEICEWKSPYFYGMADERPAQESLISEIDENRIVRQQPVIIDLGMTFMKKIDHRNLTDDQLEQIASDLTGNEDDYKGFIRGYKYAKHGN